MILWISGGPKKKIYIFFISERKVVQTNFLLALLACLVPFKVFFLSHALICREGTGKCKKEAKLHASKALLVHLHKVNTEGSLYPVLNKENSSVAYRVSFWQNIYGSLGYSINFYVESLMFNLNVNDAYNSMWTKKAVYSCICTFFLIESRLMLVSKFRKNFESFSIWGDSLWDVFFD